MSYLYEEAHVSFLENSRNKSVKNEIKVKDALQMIKEGAFKHQVNSARKIDKAVDLTSYTAVKNTIPTWTPSANFHHTKEKKNLKSLTGLYYLDIDKQSVDPDKLKSMDIIYAFWSSVSNNGYGLLIKCNYLTPDNYLKVWNEFDAIFQNENLFLDKYAKGFSRQCVFSFDPNIYINENSIIYNCNIPLPKPKAKKIKDYVPLEIELTEEEKLAKLFDNIPWVSDKKRIQLRKILDDYEGKNYIFKKEGLDTRNVWINPEIKEGHRNATLSDITIGVIYNNPEIDIDKLRKYILSINNNNCKPPLITDEVSTLVNSIYLRNVRKELVIDTKKKYTFFNPDVEMSVKEKISIGAKNAAIVRKEKRLAQLQFLYNELKLNYPKVTQKLLSDNSGVSIETIKRYWKLMDL
jgi:hypothetical protein